MGGALIAPLSYAADSAAPVAKADAPTKARHERYPEIHKAIHKLKAAKEDLEKANHDFGGHRVKAI